METAMRSAHLWAGIRASSHSANAEANPTPNLAGIIGAWKTITVELGRDSSTQSDPRAIARVTLTRTITNLPAQRRVRYKGEWLSRGDRQLAEKNKSGGWRLYAESRAEREVYFEFFRWAERTTRQGATKRG